MQTFRAASNCEIVRELALGLEACPAYYWYDLGGLIVQSMREVLIKCDEMRNVYVAVVLF